MTDTNDLQGCAANTKITDLESRLTVLESAVIRLAPQTLVTTSAPSAAGPEPTSPFPSPLSSPGPEPTSARLKISNFPPTPQSSLLLNLSYDLRYEIYRLVTRSSRKYVDVDESGYARPALLTTCKEVYLEASPIFYANHTFDLLSTNYDSTVCTRWTREISHLRPSTTVIVTNTGSPNWKNLVSWLKKNHCGEFDSFPHTYPLTSSKQRLQEKVLESCFRTAFTMRACPWDVSEVIINHSRPVLSTLDGRWAHD